MTAFFGDFKLGAYYSQFPPVVASRVDNLCAEYRKVLSELEYPEDYIELYLRKVPDAALGRSNISALKTGVLLDLMAEVRERWCKHDKRHARVYPVDVVIIVLLLCRMQNLTDCRDVADFWFEENPFLQFFIPGMPSPEHMISHETIRLIKTLVPEEVVAKYFDDYFSEVKITGDDLLAHEAVAHGDFKTTIGADGQELRSSFRRGEASRHCKGAHGVTAFNCDDRIVAGFTTVDKKNHEVSAVKTILSQISVGDNCIFFADAINTCEELTSELDRNGIDYLMPVKTNRGNKALHQKLKESFETCGGKGKFSFHDPETIRHGRVEESFFEVLPAEVIPEQLLEKYPSVKSIMRYEKISRRHLKGETEQQKSSSSVHYFISTMDCTEQGAAQNVHTLKVRWFYEQHHNTLDVVMLQDYRALCDSNHLSFDIGFNKIAYNLVSWCRQVMTVEGFGRRKGTRPETKLTPISYKRTFHALEEPEIALHYLIRYLMQGNTLTDIKRNNREL